jgi:hypothetical protein
MTETSPDAPVSTVEPNTARPPGFIRRSAVIFLVLIALVGAALFPLVVEPWIVSKVKSTLAGQGLELTPESRLSVSLFGGAVTGTNLTVRETGQSSDVFTATALNADVALIDSLTSGDVIIDSLVLEGLSGSLRRINGHIPGTPPDESGKPIDWLGLGKQLLEWYKQYGPQDDGSTDPADPGKKPEPTAPEEKVPAQPKPTFDWPDAQRYEPQPQPGKPWPRVLVRKLSISGKAMDLPDESPFDIAGFTVTGTNVALRLKADEVMDLKSDLTTKGSGPVALTITRQGGKTGTMRLSAKQVPIEALSAKNISGDVLTPYNAKGLADLMIDTQWTGWKQTSTLTSTLSGMSMQPDKDAGDLARQFAAAVNAFDGKPITWAPKLGGTLLAPVFTDTGMASLKASAVDAAKDKAIDEGKKQLDQQLDKQLDKNPELKNATDKAKDLFKGLGK